jgi:hypothetical protein
MVRAGKLTCLAAGLAYVTAAAFTLLSPGVAAAATTDTVPAGGSPVTADSGPIRFAGAAATVKTVTSQYSCDLSKYGSGIPPVTLSGSLAAPVTAAAGSPLAITLSTTSAALPSSVLSQLSGVVSVDLTATVTVQHATDASVALSGQAQVPAQLQGLPAATATGSVTFPEPGSGVIKAPVPTLTFTPHTSTTDLDAITCTTTAATQDITVTVTPPVVGTTGPLYSCVFSIAGVSAAVLAHAPMAIRSSGSRTTGKTDTVTLATPALGAPYPTGTTSVSFTGNLPVRGAQSGKVVLSNTTTDLNSPTFSVSGKLRLTKAGTDRILIPEKFTFTMHGPPGSSPLVLACTIKTTPTPVGLTIKVTAVHVQPNSSTSATTTAPGSGGGEGEGTGTPVGAPATGGGSGPGDGLGAVAGGLALMVSGSGLTFLATRRRRRVRRGQGAA